MEETSLFNISRKDDKVPWVGWGGGGEERAIACTLLLYRIKTAKTWTTAGY